jgi:chemotaxis family two-component system sensor kinase Cph1
MQDAARAGEVGAGDRGAEPCGKPDIVRIAARDLLEPVRAIRLLGSFIEEDAKGRLDSDTQQRLSQLQRICTRLQRLVESAVEAAELERAMLRPQAVNISTLVMESLQRVGPAAQKAEVVFRSGAELAVRCDRAWVVQALAQLISNGILYNESAPKRIAIEAARAGEDALIRVRDNGIGIPASQRAQVFEMSRRLHPPERFGGGAGAGLCLVRTIVERHGGRIWVEDAQGGGSSLCFTLPLA